MSRKSSARPEDLSDSLAIARGSVREIKRVSEESLFGLYELDPEKAFRLSFLREQFRFNEEWERLFNRYTERINQAYFSLFLILQTFLSVSHFVIVLVINLQSGTLFVVFLDLIFYSATGLLSLVVLYLNEGCAKRRTKILKTMSFVVFATVFSIDLAVPVYYSAIDISHNLRPAYTTHILIACYLFCNITSNVTAFALGVFVTICHLLILGFITYQDSNDYFWERLGSDVIYLACINGLGVYFRFTNELVKRRTFLDHRACVESTLKLKYEKEQEEQLMLSIIPEHTINEVRQDILKKIEMVEKLFILPSCDPLDIPYIHEYDNVTILYADIVNYTAMTSKLPVVTLVETLNELFGGFDDASEDLNVLRIKFLGDCYYCVAGLPPNPAPNHAEACVDLGLRMISIIRSVREKRNLNIDMRIGVHSGRILSGLIGSTKWQFDIWSKDVYLANKMETTGEPGYFIKLKGRARIPNVCDYRKVHITKQTYDLIKKPYNIVAVPTGSVDERLKPYNVTTFLVCPQSEEQADPPTFIQTLPKSNEKKKLSMIGEADFSEGLENNLDNQVQGYTILHNHLSTPTANGNVPDRLVPPDNNHTGSNGLLKSSSAPDFYANESEALHFNSQHYERRESLRNIQTPVGMMINRRPSGHPALGQRISGRRITPSDIKRRTAFMDNHINRYNERLSKTDENMKEAIENMPLTKYQQWIEVKEINPLLLTFRECKMEWQFVRLMDPLFKYYLVGYAILFISTTVIQNLTLFQPSWDSWLNYATLAFVIFILIPLSWMHSIWNRYFALGPLSFDDLENSENDGLPKNALLRFVCKISLAMTTSTSIRTCIFLVACGLFLTSVLAGLVECKQVHSSSKAFRKLITFLLNKSSEEFSRKQCILPWHMNYSLSLAILAAYAFLRIHIGLKLLVAATITVFYSFAVWKFDHEYYQTSETFNYMMKPQIAHILSLVFLTISMHVIDRQTDYLNRLDYQWNQKLIEEKREVNTMHKITKMLLKNILPIHVAELYLDVNRKNNVLYNEEYDNVAVIFATVVDYPTDCSERYFLGIMNRIIKDFDYLLPRHSRKQIEKIKVANLTYMAACGLDPGRRQSLIDGYSESSKEHIVVTLIKFAVEMMKALKGLNEECEQECKLRIGIDNGPVMAGVVGSKKPLYDIWGDTVNVASRMDSTGVPGKIQVTENTAKILLGFGVQCEFRDYVFAKGKGKIPTYFVKLTDNYDLVYNDSTRL